MFSISHDIHCAKGGYGKIKRYALSLIKITQVLDIKRDRAY